MYIHIYIYINLSKKNVFYPFTLQYNEIISMRNLGIAKINVSVLIFKKFVSNKIFFDEWLFQLPKYHSHKFCGQTLSRSEDLDLGGLTLQLAIC